MSEQATEPIPPDDSDSQVFADLWPWIREKFPPARAVAILTPILLPLIAIFNGWLINHLPFVADQVGPDQITAFVLATLVGGIAVAYKWLDGRARWEGKQIDAHVLLRQADKLSDAEMHSVLEPPPPPRRKRRANR